MSETFIKISSIPRLYSSLANQRAVFCTTWYKWTNQRAERLICIKGDVKAAQKSAKKRTTTEVKFKFVYCHEVLSYRRGHVSRQVRTRL